MSIDNSTPTIDKKLYQKLHGELMRTFDHAVYRARNSSSYGTQPDPGGEYAQAVAQLCEAIIKLEAVKPK